MRTSTSVSASATAGSSVSFAAGPGLQRRELIPRLPVLRQAAQIRQGLQRTQEFPAPSVEAEYATAPRGGQEVPGLQGDRELSRETGSALPAPFPRLLRRRGSPQPAGRLRRRPGRARRKHNTRQASAAREKSAGWPHEGLEYFLGTRVQPSGAGIGGLTQVKRLIVLFSRGNTVQFLVEVIPAASSGIF
jgi:hypothetical protein